MSDTEDMEVEMPTDVEGIISEVTLSKQDNPNTIEIGLTEIDKKAQFTLDKCWLAADIENEAFEYLREHVKPVVDMSKAEEDRCIDIGTLILKDESEIVGFTIKDEYKKSNNI